MYHVWMEKQYVIWLWNREQCTKIQTDMKEIEILKERMCKEIVHFSFRKSNGDVRDAHGTMMPTMLPNVVGNGKPTPSHLMLYYDTDKQSWRSFKKDNLIKVYDK